MVVLVFEILFYVIFISLGILAGYATAKETDEFLRILNPGARLSSVVSMALIGGLIGAWVAPRFSKLFFMVANWLIGSVRKTPRHQFISGAVGFIIGLLIATLLDIPLLSIPFSTLIPNVGQFLGPFVAILATMFVVYLSVSISISIPFFTVPKGEGESSTKILDTSVIIDGRVLDICQSGFLEGKKLIPKFVLEELQHIADSSDILKRNRGRRGLDILNKMRKENLGIQIYEGDVDAQGVDTKLVKLAKELSSALITNDYNLNKVAELQGIRVLNINELANAVKPVVLPGEELKVHIIKDGKEAGQGIGYMDDGTMIVVEGGRRHIGDSIDVQVTSVLQTIAGKMIFAKPGRS